MRVIVDARKAADYGIGTYIRRLGGACARLAPEDEFTFLGRIDGGSDGNADGGRARSGLAPLTGNNVSWAPNTSANYGIGELFSVSWQVRKLGADVFHAPHYVYPLMLPCPGVVTIHDCIHLRFPRQLPNPAAGVYARLMIRRAVRAADRVIAVSEATRADLIELVDADRSKIEVIPHGCDPFFLEKPAEEEVDAVRHKHGLDRPFLLSVTNIKPHKNMKRMLQAFAQLSDDYPDLDLVIAGGTLQTHPELQAICAECDIGQRVRSLGFVPKSELRALYNLAWIFVFPSLYEGFGLPPLEAMACGTPVVASRSSAIPEVVGHSGLLVNPYRVDSIAEAVRSLLENESFRNALGLQGQRRAREFDWDATARRVLAVYRSLAKAKS
jgi:glycosyltransferase involved in cell wall biosynthesis